MGWASLVGIVMARDLRRVLVEQMRSAPTHAEMGANTIELGVMIRSSGRLRDGLISPSAFSFAG